MALAGPLGPVALVDLAAGDGSLLESVLESLGAEKDRVLGRVVAVERGRAMRSRLAERLVERSTTVIGRLADIAPGGGPVVLHASELYDAVPVDRVVADAGRLLELWVAVDDGRLTWSRRPARREVEAYFRDHGVVLVDGQVAEACRRAGTLHREHLEWAGEEAVALTLDYGYEAVRLYDPRGRAQGSLACYSRHRLSRDPLQLPGEQDVTAHVNWDDLRAPATRLGWRECGLWPLAELLVRGGIEDVLEAEGLGMDAELDASTYTARQEIKRLLDPDGMGADLKVLVQAHGRPGEVVAEVLGGQVLPGRSPRE
jgi:SAM-dependent MidA family methyltransferase